MHLFGFRKLSLLLAAFSCTLQFANAQVAVTTFRYDNGRTGQNVGEAVLTPSNVNVNSFGALYTYTLPSSSYVYAQPLYLPNVNIPNVGLRNVLYIATEHDIVYAFDADGLTSTPYWTSDLAARVGGTTIPTAGTTADYLGDQLGVTSTPVIDQSSGTMYVVANTLENGNRVQRLHALDVTTGAEKFGESVVIHGTVSGATFDPSIQNQRPALLLANGNVYIGWGAYGDNGAYHGWVMAYNATTLSQVAVFCTTPNGTQGSNWALGSLTADQSGNIYTVTGNGTVDTNGDHGSSVIKLSPTLGLINGFTPSNYSDLNGNDWDLGGGGLLQLPDQPTSTPHLAVLAGKQGTLYLLNRDDLGQFAGASGGADHVVQEFPDLFAGSEATRNTNCNTSGECNFGTPAYWNNNVYFAAANHPLQIFPLSNGQFASSTPASSGSQQLGAERGTSPMVSANGTSNGIVWALRVDDASSNGPDAILYAYDATNAANKLYSSDQNSSRDDPGQAQFFILPVVANGKVYVATRSQVTIYGLLAYKNAQPPLVQLGVNPTSGAAPLTVTASTSGSSDPNTGGNIVSSWINFGDGTAVNATTATHTYTSPGTYTVTATVYGSSGKSARTTTTVTAVSDQPPVAKLSVTPTSGNVPLTVTASTSQSSDPDGTVTSSSINFGDGTVVSGFTAQHTYNSSGTYTVTGTVTDNAGLSSTATATVAVGPLADNSAFVTQQFEDFLDRTPDSGALSYYTNQLNSGSMSRAQVIASLMGSPEFAGKGLFVAQAYLGILARDADYGGFRWALGLIESGTTEEQLVNMLLQSQEFQTNFGSNLDNGQFVTRMYENILLRQPDQSGYNYYVGQLNSGTMTRAQVALSLLQSSEFQNLSASQNRVKISLLYFDMLRRQPDSGGFSYYVGLLNSGTTQTSITNSFLGSSEYAARFPATTATMTSINHVVFMLQENRTFDNYFGMLNPYRKANGWNIADDGKEYDVDGIDDKLSKISNTNDEGTVYNLFKLQTTCTNDMTSDWLASYGDVNRYNFSTTRQIVMDGFVHTAEGYAKVKGYSDAAGKRAMGYYDQGFLNYYYYMASQFAISDRWFSPVSSKTVPNRIAVMTGGTTQGLVYDPGHDDGLGELNIKTIFQQLDQHGVSWKIYYTDTDPSDPFPSTSFGYFTYSSNYMYSGTCQPPTTNVNGACIDTSHIAPLSQYFTDVQNGTLPHFAYIEAGYNDGTDEHPSDDVIKGQQQVAKIINALMNSPSWKDSVFFLSYDEGGGPYDHVPPVPGHTNDNTDASLNVTTDIKNIAVNPDQYNPCQIVSGSYHCDLRTYGSYSDPGWNSSDAPAQQGFAAQLGFRVPNLVISPFTRRHYVSHIPMDHTAIIKFVETRFIGSSASLTARDAAQPNLLDLFDFNAVPWATPPSPPGASTASSCNPTNL